MRFSSWRALRVCLVVLRCVVLCCVLWCGVVLCCVVCCFALLCFVCVAVWFLLLAMSIQTFQRAFHSMTSAGPWVPLVVVLLCFLVVRRSHAMASCLLLTLPYEQTFRLIWDLLS